MVTRSPMVAKAMSAHSIDPHKAKGKDSSTLPQFNPTIGMTTRPPKKPAAGSNPKASMIDGPFGGKKPVGTR